MDLGVWLFLWSHLKEQAPPSHCPPKGKNKQEEKVSCANNSDFKIFNFSGRCFQIEVVEIVTQNLEMESYRETS